ncbi:MAG: F0F1 ATP synthase subunit epsilon [Flavobacteriales bacterium]
MFVTILTPEETIFSGAVDSVSVPGAMGAFQMLNGHAAIVSDLVKGHVRIHTHRTEHIDYDSLHAQLIPHPDDDQILEFPIQGGVVEMKGDKIIVLADA